MTRLLALALAVALTSIASLAPAAPYQPEFQLRGVGKLSAPGLGSLKLEVGLFARICCDVASGGWSALEQEGGRYTGAFYAADDKARKFDLIFDAASLGVVAESLRQLVLDEAGIDAVVLSIHQRQAVLKVDKAFAKAELKLTFDILALVDGRVITAKYTLPLKGGADLVPLPN